MLGHLTEEYHNPYNFEIDHDDLSEQEQDVFNGLFTIACRCSPFENDHQQYPGTYFTTANVRQITVATKHLLADNFEQFYIYEQIHLK